MTRTDSAIIRRVLAWRCRIARWRPMFPVPLRSGKADRVRSYMPAAQRRRYGRVVWP